jgi:hypothetical protein
MLLEYPPGGTLNQITQGYVFNDGVVVVYPCEVGEQVGVADKVDRFGIELFHSVSDRFVLGVLKAVVAGTCGDLCHAQAALLEQGDFGFLIFDLVHCYFFHGANLFYFDTIIANIFVEQRQERRCSQTNGFSVLRRISGIPMPETGTGYCTAALSGGWSIKHRFF